MAEFRLGEEEEGHQTRAPLPYSTRGSEHTWWPAILLQLWEAALGAESFPQVFWSVACPSAACPQERAGPWGRCHSWQGLTRLPASVSWRGRSSWERCWKKAEKLGGVHERAPEMSFQSTMMISFLLDHFWPLKGIFCTAWFCSCHGQVYACSCFAEMSQKKINVCSACRSPRLSFTGWALETQPLGMWIQNVLEKITEREAVEGLFN